MTTARLGPWPWVLVAAGAIGAFAIGAQPWWQVPYPGGTVPIPGNDAAGGLPATLAGVVAAGLLLALTLRGWGRVVLGVVLGLVGIGAVVLGLAAPHPPTDVVDRLVQAATLDQPGAPTRAWGGYGYAAAGVLVLLGAVGSVLAARHTAGRNQSVDRFARSSRTRAVAADDDPLNVWRALDDGHDPTAGDSADDDHTSTPVSPPPDDGARMDRTGPQRPGRQT